MAKITYEINEFQVPCSMLFFSFFAIFFFSEVSSEVQSPERVCCSWERDYSWWGPGECWERSHMDTCPVVVALHLQLLWAVLWCAPRTTSAAACWWYGKLPHHLFLLVGPAPTWSLSSQVGPALVVPPLAQEVLQECMWLFLGIGDTVLFMFLQKLYLKAKFGQHLKLLK